MTLGECELIENSKRKPQSSRKGKLYFIPSAQLQSGPGAEGVVVTMFSWPAQNDKSITNFLNLSSVFFISAY